MAEIHIEIEVDGTPTMEGKGFTGGDCHAKMKPLEDAFEGAQKDERTTGSCHTVVGATTGRLKSKA